MNSLNRLCQWLYRGLLGGRSERCSRTLLVVQRLDNVCQEWHREFLEVAHTDNSCGTTTNRRSGAGLERVDRASLPKQLWLL